jgi:hypothetical protein
MTVIDQVSREGLIANIQGLAARFESHPIALIPKVNRRKELKFRSVAGVGNSATGDDCARNLCLAESFL